MRKKYIGTIIMAAITLANLVWYGCSKYNSEDEETGSIYGTVTDFATGEPVENANVTLRQTGATTLTGADGTYEFLNVSSGNYNINVSRAEYTDLLDDYVIVVKKGQKTKRDVQIEKLPSALRIINSATEEISDLDFGTEEDVTSRTFSIFNDSPSKISWWIELNCNWITEVKSMLTNNQGGQIEPGKQEPVKVTIDRSKLSAGLNTYILNINSDNGSKELKITAGENVWKPSLSTRDVSNLEQNSVTFNGVIDDEGKPTYTERGFVYSTTAQPTIERNDGKITSAVNSQSSFSANESGLLSNTPYYVRAYAKNDVGVAYGNDVTFTTKGVVAEVSVSEATSVGSTTATLNGTIMKEGIPAYTEKGFCYSSENTQPKINDNKIVVGGSGIGPFETRINNLDYPKRYYVKAYVMQNGSPIYSNNVVEFSTSATKTEVQTSGVSGLSATSATFNGSIIEIGDPPYSERGFCYSSTASNPTISNNKIAVSGSGAGNYSYNVTGLGYQTTYYVRAYAIQNGQPVYGNTVNFTTSWTDAQVQTSAATDITASSAKLNGIVTNAGSPAYTERGFCYDNYSNQPTINNNKIVCTGSGVTGNYNKNITGLTSGQTYYVRAYVMQNGVAKYGTSVEFKTIEPPVVYTDEVSALTPVASSGIILSWKVTFNGHIGSVGSPAYVERGFCYGTSANPTGNKQIVSGSGTGSFSKNITGLQNYQTYYVRAYAKTSSGTYVYGQNVSFQTYD